MITTRRKNQLNKLMHDVKERFIMTPYIITYNDDHVYIYTDFLYTSVIIEINKFTKNCEKHWFVIPDDGKFKLKISISI